MARTAALALAFLALTVGDAQATTFRVVAVPGLGLEVLEELAERGAVGLVVPGAGPETSREIALAALERGEVRNSLRGGIPEGEPLVAVEVAATIPSGDGLVVVGIPDGGLQSNDRRYPVAVIGLGFEGLLTSDSTRIPGLVSIADVAPTALGRDDGLGFQPADEPANELRNLDARIDEKNDVHPWATLLALVLVALLALARPHAALAAFAALLATNLVLGWAGVSDAWVVLLAVGLAVLVGGPLLAGLLATPLALGVAFALVLGAYLLAFALDGTVVALSPFGPSQNARFYGLSNLLETLLLVPALAGAALLARRFGAPGFALVALLAFVVVAGNRFGADGGGAVVLGAGFAVLTLGLAERARLRIVAAVLGLAVSLIGLDLATGGSSHVSDSVRGGPGELAGDLADRVALSWERTTSSPWTAALVGVLLLAFALLVARTVSRAGWSREAALPLALAAALATSLVVNDSPNDVLMGGLAAYLAVERGMLPRR
ncbi:MAG: hypothetical protein ACRDON_00135 [Gaiellaceae bacterium]